MVLVDVDDSHRQKQTRVIITLYVSHNGGNYTHWCVFDETIKASTFAVDHLEIESVHPLFEV